MPYHGKGLLEVFENMIENPKIDGSVVLVPFFGSMITRDSVHVVGHSPGLQILLQTEVRMASPALTNSDGMLSTAADFPIFSALTAASTSSCIIG